MEGSNAIFRGYTEPVLVMHKQAEQPYVFVPHLHSSLEIYYNINGCKTFLVNDKFYHCDANDMFIVPCLHIHKALLNDQSNYERCVISISAETISKISEMPNLSEKPFEILFFPDKDSSPKVHLSPDEHITLMKLIYSYNDCENDTTDKFIIFLRILQFISKKYSKNTIREKDFSPETVAEKVLGYIEQNFKSYISVKKLSEKIALSEAQLYRLFKKETGMTVKEYITMRRIAEAKKLLILGYSVKEAGYNSGFNDYQNFIKAFKKVEGYPPGQMEELTYPI